MYQVCWFVINAFLLLIESPQLHLLPCAAGHGEMMPSTSHNREQHLHIAGLPSLLAFVLVTESPQLHVLGCVAGHGEMALRFLHFLPVFHLLVYL